MASSDEQCELVAPREEDRGYICYSTREDRRRNGKPDDGIIGINDIHFARHWNRLTPTQRDFHYSMWEPHNSSRRSDSFCEYAKGEGVGYRDLIRKVRRNYGAIEGNLVNFRI
jgi:hypothetical protein